MNAPKQKPEKFTQLNGTVSSFVSDGFSEITGLGEELREAYDNAPDNLKGTSVNEARDSTASEIENLSEPDVPEALQDLDCVTSIDNGKVYRGRQTQSRACRASNAASQLRAAAETVREWLERHEEIEDADPNDAAALKARAEAIEKIETEGMDIEAYNTAVQEGEALADELESMADTIEGLEFPGMFG